VNDEVKRNLPPLEQALKDFEYMLGIIELGRTDNVRRFRRIQLAVQHIKDWQVLFAPSMDESRGGSAPSDQDEREEDARVARAALRDEEALAKHLRAAREIVERCTVPIDHSKLPSELPGCVSCARKRQKGGVEIAGHFAPVAERKAYASKHLCRWCGDIERASGAVPPLEAVDLYHRAGPQAAGKWLADYFRKTQAVA
jgi:hypothetical protein